MNYFIYIVLHITMHGPYDKHHKVSSFLKSHQNTHNSVKYEVICNWHFVMLLRKEHFISLASISWRKWQKNYLRTWASKHSSNFCEQFRQRPNFVSIFKSNGTIWYPFRGGSRGEVCSPHTPSTLCKGFFRLPRTISQRWKITITGNQSFWP